MEDFEYLVTDCNSIVLTKDDLVKTLNLISRLAQNNSASIESSSLSFIPDWEHRTITLTITNDLTYFRNYVELMGEEKSGIRDVFSIKVETLNKLKPFFRDKVLIYVKDGNYFIRLIDGDLLVATKIPDISRLAFTASDNQLIYSAPVESFCKLLSSYKNMIDDYSDKWLAFDGEKLSLCGLNFYAETTLKTPLMCLLMQDVDLIVRLEQYYKDSTINIVSTDSTIPKLHIKVDTVEIEIMNVVSNLNRDMINKLSGYIKTPSISVDTNSLYRVISLGLALPDLEKDIVLKDKDSRLLVILNNKKGDSEFNLEASRIGDYSTVDTTKLSLITLEKIVSVINSDSTARLTLDKIYTTVCSDNISAIILNK